MYYYYIKLVLLSIIFQVVFCKNCDDPDVKKACHRNVNCLDCMKEHECCNWCLYSEFETGFSCDTLTNCNGSISKNSPSNITDVSHEELTPEFQGVNTHQMVPKSIYLSLRKGQPINITFKYKPVRKYPLSLYYLVDISYSMKDHVEDLKNLGEDLKKLNFTDDYQVALGSFMDKPLMPFYRTAGAYMDNPCLGSFAGNCSKGFLFKHVLNFTKTWENFTSEVHKLDTSANLDDLDAASSALMQILSCQHEFQWRDDSRKQILLATSSLMHWGGDGLLSGSTKNHPFECLSDKNLTSNIYDYPSLEDIEWLLKQQKTNLIIATKPQNKAYYDELSKVLGPTCFVGELKTDDSQNVINLLKDGYNQFIKSAEFFANYTNEESFLKIEFFNNCSGVWNRSSECLDINENDLIEVKAEFTLLSDPYNTMTDISIEERSIDEKINVHINYKGIRCDCENAPKNKERIECVHGTIDCDGCQCEPGWTGKNCSRECTDSYESCRANNSLTCSHNGDCVCGKCQCDKRYSGLFCEFRCPTTKDDLVCNGQECRNGQCNCNENFTGDVCDCSKSKTNCELLDKICLNNGDCECNKCECLPGFKGKNCNIDTSTNTDVLCDNLEGCILQKYKQKNLEKSCLTTVELKSINTTEYMECSTTYEKKGEICTINFEYSMKENIAYHTEPTCNVKSQKQAYIWGGIAILIPILIGLATLIIWKGIITRQDRIEYEAFMREKSFQTEQSNPLYKNPVTEYKNPLLQKK